MKKSDRLDLILNVIKEKEIANQEELTEKPVTLAIREVAEGKVSASLKEEYMK